MAHDPGEAANATTVQGQPKSRRSASLTRLDSDLLEATELSQIRIQYSRATESYSHTPGSTAKASRTGFWWLRYAIWKFWRNQISVVVAHEACRDHLALERTFLGYLRTSLVLSMIGVTVAQLFRLQHAPNPDSILGFFVLGKPLACICQGSAIYSLLLGAYRCWRHQHAMIRGKAIAGGLEVFLLGFGILLLCLLFFVMVIAVDISKGE